MKKVIYMLLLLLIGRASCAFAQVAIGSENEPHPSAVLDISALGPLKLGFLIPRVHLTGTATEFVLSTENKESKDPAVVKTEAEGMVVYSVARPAGVYVWTGTRWNALGSARITECGKPLWDIDGNVYHTKAFGSQCWMTDNLRVSRTKNGRALQRVYVNSPYGEGEYDRTATVQWVNNHVNFYPTADASSQYFVDSNTNLYNLDFNAFANTFGFHYSWKDAKQACPEGWRLPDAADFESLAIDDLGGIATAGKRMKANNRWYYQFYSGSGDGGTGGSVGYQWGGYDIGNSLNSGFNGLPNGFIQQNGGTVQYMSDDNKGDIPLLGAVGELVYDGMRSYSFGRYAYWWVNDKLNDKVLSAIGSAEGKPAIAALFPEDALSEHPADVIDESYLFGVRCVKE